MHLNFYFLQKVCTALQERLVGYRWEEGYLINRYEAVLCFYREEFFFYTKVNLYPDFTCLSFPKEIQKNKKGGYSIFYCLKNKMVKTVQVHKNDRSFHIEFEDSYNLVFKLHGSRSNLVLFENNTITELVNKKLQADYLLSIPLLEKKATFNYEQFVSSNGSIRSLSPAIDNDMAEYFERLYTPELSLDEKWKIIEAAYDSIISAPIYISKCDNKLLLHFYKKGEVLFETTDPLEASTVYERYAGSKYYFDSEYTSVVSSLLAQKKKHEKYLQTLAQRKTEIGIAVKYNEIADTIMANLHTIPKNTRAVRLENVYTNEPIEIRLKSELSPQKNAEVYYRKSKNQKLEIEELDKNIAQRKKTSQELMIHLENIQTIHSLKALRNYCIQNNLSTGKVIDKNEEVHLFKKFTIEGFEIWVGKNARNNDLLTQRHSFKDDLWLHARDVSGSHVLIKYQAGKKFPKTVIEKAAQLAAYYSKRKNDTLCPVIITPKKYVRKPKGAAEGAVIVEREEVLMVVPAIPDIH